MVFIFILSWVLLFIAAVRLMIRGLSIDPQRDVDLSYKVEKRTVTKMPHPEMTDVKQGDELLVVKFGGEEKKDPLLQSLENRITELNDPWEEDDDEDDDGDIIVRT